MVDLRREPWLMQRLGAIRPSKLRRAATPR